jgi:hypothetical protein
MCGWKNRSLVEHSFVDVSMGQVKDVKILDQMYNFVRFVMTPGSASAFYFGD